MKLAYPLIIVIAIFIGCQSQSEKQNELAPVVNRRFPNTLINKKFVTEKLIGLVNDKSDYLLSDYQLIDTTIAAEWSGNTVRFVDSVHYVSAYQAWCGNDCFTSVFGRYYFIDNSKVRFYTDSITSSGECEAPTVHDSRPALDLYLVKTPEGHLQLNHTSTQRQ